MKLKIRQKTKTPKQRTNEDAKLVDRVRNIFIVADGMGNHPSGQEASNLVIHDVYLRFRKNIEYIPDFDMNHDDIKGLIEHAVSESNEMLYGLSESVERFRRGRKRAGTTLLFGYFREPHFYLASVGDSLSYLYSTGKLKMLHELDSFQPEGTSQLDAKIKELSTKTFLTNYIGKDSEIPIKVINFEVKPNDIILLSTDGLTKTLLDDDMADIMHRTDFERITSELTKGAYKPKKELIEGYSKINDIDYKKAKKELMNRDSTTMILIKSEEN